MVKLGKPNESQGKLKMEPEPISVDRYGLKFLYGMDTALMETPSKVVNQITKRIATDFSVNVGRCYSLAGALPLVAQFSAVNQAWHTEAIHRVTGDFKTDSLGTEELSAIHAEFIRIGKEWLEQQDPDHNLVDMVHWMRGADRIEELLTLEKQGGSMSQAIETLLASVLLGFWTAIETCTADLLLAVLNEGPKQFVDNIIGVKTLMPDSELTRNQQAQIDLVSLKDYGYDLRARMGDLLRDTKRIDFQRLKNTEKAYISAFGKGVETIFDKNNENYANVMILSAIRNVIVHNSGIVDDQYVDKIKLAKGASLASLVSLKSGDRVPFNGPIVKVISRAIGAFSTALLVFVDTELVKIPIRQI